jgi:hypothetical protein
MGLTTSPFDDGAVTERLYHSARAEFKRTLVMCGPSNELKRSNLFGLKLIVYYV